MLWCSAVPEGNKLKHDKVIQPRIRGHCDMWSKGWRSGESARLPPMWPGFKSRRRRHMWVEFVVGSLPCSERFFSGYSGFPLSIKTNISEFQFGQELGRRRTILQMCYLQITIIIIIIIIIIICSFVTQCSPNSKEKLENAMNYRGTMCNLLKHRLWLELIQWIELLELLSAKTCFIFCVKQCPSV